jgi:hypothetical protein
MNLKHIAALISLTATFVCGPSRQGEAARAVNCQLQPATSPDLDENWAYRPVRTTGQRCRLPVRKRIRKAVDEAAAAPEYVLENPTAPACLAAPSGVAPHNARWRYLIDHRTGQKCWRLTPGGMRTAARAGSSRNDNLGRLRSVSGSHASLSVPGTLTASDVSDARQHDPGDRAPKQASMMLFESRWITPTEFNRGTDVADAQNKSPTLLEDNGDEPTSGIVTTHVDQSEAVGPALISRLLVAAVASIAIATGLYVAISGSASIIQWTRGLGTAQLVRNDLRKHQPPLPRDTTIAEILERLNREDELYLAGPRTPNVSKPELRRSDHRTNRSGSRAGTA